MRHRLLIFVLLMQLAVPGRSQTAALHVAILGDSNTWLGGDDCRKPRGWNTWFRESLAPATCRSYARSGATWTHTEDTKQNTTEDTGVLSDDNVIFNQVWRLRDAVRRGEQACPDLILIAAGTNDVWFPQKRPRVFAQRVDEVFAATGEPDLTAASEAWQTLAGAVRNGCEMLQESFPDAQIILLTPMQSTAIETADITKAGDVIEACGMRMNLSVIRMDREGCVNRMREQRRMRYTYDGTHTSEAGARRNGRYVANRVRSLLEY
ncbi:MAG: SGNH/GDSL hydrolase family protein [Bacteroidaceae bacterium]|nr:SGNH/GDSL hydrolase family protein [Bacteroidaceae bacterium]